MDPACRCGLDSHVGNRQSASHLRWRTCYNHMGTVWTDCSPSSCNSTTWHVDPCPSPPRLCCPPRFTCQTLLSRAAVGSGGGPASPITTPPLPPRHGAPDSTAGVWFCVFAHHGLLFTVASDNTHKMSSTNKYRAVTMAGSFSIMDNARSPSARVAPFRRQSPM